jgi:YVTN family beta-propeller protein
MAASKERYDRTAVLLHWAIGGLLVAQIAFGFALDDLAPRGTPARGAVINLHKSCGLLLFALVVLRLGWRLGHPPPAGPAMLAPWQRRAAAWGHRALYGAMLLLPLAGYLASNFSRHGIKFFGVALAPWGPDLPAVYRLFNGLHVALALGFTLLIAGHVAVAVYHAAIARDGIAARMLPLRFGAWLPALGGLAVMLGLPLLAASANSATPSASASPTAPLAYVANEGSGSLSIIDTGSDAVVGEIPAGKKPRGTVITRDGLTAYVSDQPNNRLLVVDLAQRRVSGDIPLGESPEGVGLSPDGRWVVAAVEERNEVVFVDAKQRRKAFTVAVKGKNPEHAVFSPDGTLLFVSAEEGDAVDIIDVAARRQVAQVPVGARPRGIGFSPDGRRAYVAAENSSELFVIDVASRSVLKRMAAGPRANGITVHPDGRQVFISNGGEGSVSVLDAEKLEIVATIPVGQRPWNMALTPDGRKLYVACGRSHAVSVIDVQRRERLADIAVGKLPWGVAIR